jgi:hypothetical protein
MKPELRVAVKVADVKVVDVEAYVCKLCAPHGILGCGRYISNGVFK